MRTLLKIAFVPGLLAATLTLASCQSEPIAPQTDAQVVADTSSVRPMNDQPPKNSDPGGN